MKITKINTYTVFVYRANYTFIKIETDEGISGVGESTLEYLEKTIEEALKNLEPYLIGKDPSKIESIWHDIYRDIYWRGGPVMMSALSGIDQALWDIKGKKTGLPIYELIGGKYRDKIMVYANGWFAGARTPEDFALKAKDTIEMGFKALKFDPFGNNYMEISNKELLYSLDKILAVRDVTGPDIEILIEAHGRFDVPTAVKIGKELENIKNIRWFEEPIPPDNIEALKSVKNQVRIPIAVGERYYEKKAFISLLNAKAIDVIQPDVSHAGGISELRKIGAIAEAMYIPISPHNPSGPVACAATLQLAALIPNFNIFEFMVTDVLYRHELSTEELLLEDGCINIPRKPGLGIDIKEKNFLKYPYKQVMLRHYDNRLTEIRTSDSKPYYKNIINN